MTPAEIRALRRSLGLTQAQLGDLLGLSVVGAGRTVRSWEVDRRANSARTPSGPVVILMALLQAESQGTDALYRAFGDLWAEAGVARLNE